MALEIEWDWKLVFGLVSSSIYKNKKSFYKFKKRKTKNEIAVDGSVVEVDDFGMWTGLLMARWNEESHRFEIILVVSIVLFIIFSA